MVDVVWCDEAGATDIALVGGKGAGLGELARVEGLRVPPGFCVTTDAFRRFAACVPSFEDLLDRLSRVAPDDHAALRKLGATLRDAIEDTAVPEQVHAAIAEAVVRLGHDVACAVRSSATAEDLPWASFAGQHDTYLGVRGAAEIVRHVRRCWASLFTERAVTYRVRNGVDHRDVAMAVVVQRLVAADASGVLFTADPVTGRRGVVTIEAVRGLGEPLVSGRVNADVCAVRDRVIDRSPATDHLPHVLSDAQVLALAELGRRVDAHLGRPQDIEWCLASDGISIVQSRPITTLFPVPASGDGANHVYVSVGHQQMMTDAMKALGLSLFQLTALRPMDAAGGRLFVDVTSLLASPAARGPFMEMLGRSDPLIRDALQTIVDRDGFLPPPADAPAGPPAGGTGAPSELATDPTIVPELMARTRASIDALRRAMAEASGPAVFDLIVADLPELKRMLFDPRNHQAIMAGMEATWWLNEHLETWLGEKHAADTLAQSVPHNITSEMGLALLDVADAIRPHPDLVAHLEAATGDDFLDDLLGLDGGPAARDAILAYLDTYGMRGVGEIDITRPRWRERPATLLPLILGNVRNFGPGAAAQRFASGQAEAERKEHELLGRLRALPGGEQKAAETKRMIDRLRTFIGYREHPKYGIIGRYFVYKQALLREAQRLVDAHVLDDVEDIFHLTFDELRDCVATQHVDADLIRRRKDEYRWFQSLTPPRVLTSDGEAVSGTDRRADLPAGALGGVGVSTGTVEGRARVVHHIAHADLEPGDILVTTFTDPSWSPLFVQISGLVTEVGGLMTHGAVIAREYGLPAVVGVENATRAIRDGQRIRVHGTEGFVVVLSEQTESDRA